MAVSSPARSPIGATSITLSHRLPVPCQLFSRLARYLDGRSAPRLALLFLGALLARGRRTVTSWIRAAKLSDQFRPCYTAVAAAGKRANRIAARLVIEVVKPVVSRAERLTLVVFRGQGVPEEGKRDVTDGDSSQGEVASVTGT